MLCHSPLSCSETVAMQLGGLNSSSLFQDCLCSVLYWGSCHAHASRQLFTSVASLRSQEKVEKLVNFYSHLLSTSEEQLSRDESALATRHPELQTIPTGGAAWMQMLKIKVP